MCALASGRSLPGAELRVFVVGSACAPPLHGSHRPSRVLGSGRAFVPPAPAREQEPVDGPVTMDSPCAGPEVSALSLRGPLHR